MLDPGLATSRAERVAQLLEEEIRAHQTPEGESLGTKDELQKRFKVARATLNEAIRLLKDRGYVQTRSGPKGGIFVTTPDASVQLGRFLVSIDRDVSEVANVLEIREHLELLLARHAALHATAADIAELRHLMDVLGTTYGEIARTLDLVWQLHARIAEISPNGTLRSFYFGLVNFLQSNVRESQPRDVNESFFESRLSAHRNLVEAIATGDPDSAEAAAQAHNDE